MCARRTGEYEEEVCGPKKEEEPQRQLLDAVFNLQPRIVLRRAEISENLHPEQQQSISCHIKEEEKGEGVQCIQEEKQEIVHVKEEEQEESIQVPATVVQLKSEDGQSEESQGADPPNRNSSSDGDHCEGSQTDGHDDDDDYDDEQSDLTCHTANKSWKCPQCRKAFVFMRNLKRHMKRHTDITEDLRMKWQEPDPLHIKEEIDEEGPISIKKEKEEKQPHIKQEKEEDTSKFPMTGVPMKSEDEGKSEESRGGEPPSSSLRQHMRRESDGDQNRGSYLGGLLAPLSHHDDLTSESPDTDDDEQCEGSSTAVQLSSVGLALLRTGMFSEKHPKSMMLPPPCFTGGMVFLGWNSSFVFL
ncbi:cilia- and flagella-associated protein 251-like isoform X6 [Syngnathoides biaculeatus]|uniref:cilia- and flagella-associated protein 251-like isoform X6 n=1 Tax=Syngnathoides biaculeatus TaxID=300417 RepID=UPI002ADDDAF0|nr:cilia- and flagella-associated protein 251-like isoform X6 [Syngnathoides biaculeatus]